MPNFDTPSGQERSSNQPTATDAGNPHRLMVTIVTIHDLLTFNGSAHPVTVALTRDELRRVREINADMLAALRGLVTEDDINDPVDLRPEWKAAVAAIAKAEGKP